MTGTTECSRHALDGIVVLDLSGPMGNYCGKLFADLGADVILVEPATGVPTRGMEPMISGHEGAEASLVYQYQNTNKRSVVLDLEHAGGQQSLRALVKGADLLIESEHPGVMHARGLDYQTLRKINPALVMASITPFGQSGPYADWQAEDIVGLALGGMLYLGGYTDTAPIAAFGDQAISAANLFAAVAAMAALYDAEASGSGQHIDISMQECVVMGLENAVQFYDLEGVVRKRTAGKQRLAGTGVFRCKDGYIYLMAGGVVGNRFWPITTQWLLDEGVEGAQALADPRWLSQDFLATDEARKIFLDIFNPFVLAHTKQELHEKGRARRIPIAPVYDTSDLEHREQLRHREYFVSTPGPYGTLLRMPGAPYKLSATPWSLRHGAPRLGEHTQEILAQVGATAQSLARIEASGEIQ